MGWALGSMIASSVLTTVSTVYNSEMQRQHQQSQANMLDAQANATRRQADLQAKQGELEAQEIERQKSKLRREFEEAQGRNRSLLAAGNVAMDSGSAQEVSEGNIDRFGVEMGENAYGAALKRWETEEQRKQGYYQADLYNAQASYLNRSSGSLGLSLLKGAIAGGAQFGSMAGASGYFDSKPPEVTQQGLSQGIYVRRKR